MYAFAAALLLVASTAAADPMQEYRAREAQNRAWDAQRYAREADEARANGNIDRARQLAGQAALAAGDASRISQEVMSSPSVTVGQRVSAGLAESDARRAAERASASASSPSPSYEPSGGTSAGVDSAGSSGTGRRGGRTAAAKPGLDLRPCPVGDVCGTIVRDTASWQPYMDSLKASGLVHLHSRSDSYASDPFNRWYHVDYVRRAPPGAAGGEVFKWDPLESTCRHASLSIL